MKLIKSDYDKNTGMTEEFWYTDPIGDKPGKITIRRYQDIEDQLNFNQQCFASHSKIGYSDSQDGAHHVARIPFATLEKWKQQGFDWFHSTSNERKAMLNKIENRCLLVRPGRL